MAFPSISLPILPSLHRRYCLFPRSWTGFPKAFPHFATKRVEVEAFEAGGGGGGAAAAAAAAAAGGGELFQTPTNASHFLWQSAASNFIPCDGQRNAVFAKKSTKPAALDPVKDKARIKDQMALIIGACVCVGVCVCGRQRTERERPTDKRRHRLTNRNTDEQTNKQTQADRQTDTDGQTNKQRHRQDNGKSTNVNAAY